MENNITENVVVSSRIRLARNCTKVPFPQSLRDENAVNYLISVAEKAADFKHSLVLMANLDSIDRQALVEKHLISPDLAQKRDGAVILSNDKSISVMINEEDHIRAQCIENGLALDECYNTINAYDDNLSKVMPVAYDSEFGYLTACLTNVGTGMRASVMMFLPALTFSNNIGSYLQFAKEKFVTVRGVYGERSNPTGCLYQFSNARSIGEQESTFVEQVTALVLKICAAEQGLRRQLYNENKYEWEDRVYRAYGILSNARKLSSNDFMELVAYLKFGMAMDIIDFNNVDLLDELIVSVQPANLLKLSKLNTLDAETRDRIRASIVRSELENLK